MAKSRLHQLSEQGQSVWVDSALAQLARRMEPSRG